MRYLVYKWDALVYGGTIMHLRNKRLLCAVLALVIAALPVCAMAAADSIFILGNQYDEVKEIQQKLIDLGYLKSKATGYFGNDTQQALMAFQKDKGLTADGKAGSATQKALLGKVFPSKKGTAQETAKQPAASQPATQQPADQQATKSVSSAAKPSIFIYGNQFEEVKDIQKKLIELGYLKASATGFYGKATEQAVRDFQKANKLTADGKCGPATQKALMGAAIPSKSATTGGNTTLVSTTKPTATTATNGGTIFVLGNSYEEVKEIQKKLKSLGYMTAGATGYYGTQTQQAVYNFQKAKGLKADGKCGPATQLALLGKTLGTTKTTPTSNVTVKDPVKVDVPSGSSAKGQQTVELAKKHLGKPYLWGGNGPASFDCSGLVVYVLKQQGQSSRRNSYQMSLDTKWREVSFANMRPGDLMFFDTRADKSAPIGHVGIYAGNGTMVHASSGSGKIVMAGVTSGYFRERFRIARRVFS